MLKIESFVFPTLKELNHLWLDMSEPTHTRLTPKYLEKLLDTVYQIVIEKRPIDIEAECSTDLKTARMLSHYESVVFNYKMQNEVILFDNDGTLGVARLNHEPKLWSRKSTLPKTDSRMMHLVKSIHDPTKFAFIATGRKMIAIDDNVPNSMAIEIAKLHEVPVDRVFTNILNGHMPENWTDQINNEVHKAICLFLLVSINPNAIVQAYDDHRRALELEHFAVNYAYKKLKSQEVKPNGSFSLFLVNLETSDSTPYKELDQSTLDVEKFVCFVKQ